jgi:opacity protein-like surface antigen
MSRKLLVVAALAAFALPAASAQAQLGFGVAAGLSAPTGDFGKSFSSGYHVTGLVNVSAPLAPVGFRGEVSFNQFGVKSGIGAPSDLKANILSGTANAVVSTPGMMGFYGIGGIGMYHNSSSCSGCASDSENKFGFNAGAGFKFGLSGFSAFVEARYHTFSNGTANGGGSTSWIPVSFGITF